MIPSLFDYFAPSTLDETLLLLDQYGEDGKILAGGHSLIPAMRLRLAQPEKIIDIGALRPQLSYIKQNDNNIVIGAMTSYYEIETSTLLKETWPVLPEATSLIGDTQIRNWGTIGGSLVHADPSSDLPAVLLALGAELVLQSKAGGERLVPIEEFFVHIMTTSIEPNELLIEIRIPKPQGQKASYVKLANKASHYAVVGAAVVVSLNQGIIREIKIAFSGLAATPLRAEGVEEALKGQLPNDAIIAAACKECAAEVDALTDLHGSQEYRRAMAEVYAKRAIKAAISRNLSLIRL
ncbi:MAG: xanthine dehydrogenase family protein subunit M [Chloroflexi bacterium]|nr:xanthine dehydrogenase family protein subunit M [Chloroflexota bacterium]